MKTEMPLTGQEIYLRSLVRSDASSNYISWLSNPEITQYLEVRFSAPQSLSQLQDFIEQSGDSSDSLLLGIFLRVDDRHIGNIKLGPIDWNHLTGDIGLLIGDQSQWGRGYASAAIHLVAQYAFQGLKLAKLTAGCYAENRGSMNAFFKVGFIHEGTRASQWQVGKKRQDGILLGKVNPDLKDHLVAQE